MNDIKINVAHVVRQYLPSIGGMEEVVRSLADHQLRSGRYQPQIVTLNRLFKNSDEPLPASELVEGIEVRRLAYFGSNRYPVCLSALDAIKDADIIHVHGIDFFFDFFAITKSIHRKPLVASTHGGFFHTKFASRFKQVFFKTITRASISAYTKVAATSENDRNVFLAIADPERIDTIENGVDLDKFSGQASGCFSKTIIYFGRWSNNKGLLQSIDLIKELNTLDPADPWNLIISGREYDLSINDLHSYAKQIGVDSNLSLVANPSNTELIELIRKSSYYICLSSHEGFGIAPIEAMSAGLFPILSRIPPFEKLVQGTKLGVLVDEMDVNGTAKLIIQTHKSLNQEIALQARVMESVESYSWNNVFTKYEDMYSYLLRDRYPEK